MKILMIVESKHLENTKKVAEAIAKVAPVTITDSKNALSYNLNDYDIIGFGSGIYIGKHDQRLIQFVETIHEAKRYSFVLSTSGGVTFEKNNKAMVDVLERKKIVVLGSFSCRALDKFFILRFFGGVNKGHPNEADLRNAQNFILDIIKKYEAVKN